MKRMFRGVHVIVATVSAVVALVAGCAHVATVNETVVTITASPRDIDVLDAAKDAAGAVGLPRLTKLDKVEGVVEFGAFAAPAAGYAAQVRRYPDARVDVTVRRGSADADVSVEEKARELVAALEARLRQAPARTPTSPPAPSGPAPSSPPPAAPPAATPAPPSGPAPQEPAPESPLVTRVVSVSHANFREAGNMKAKVIRVLPKNTRATVLGKAGQWYLVRLEDGTEGWLAESVTSPDP